MVGTIGNNNANGDNGFNGTSGITETNGTIEWQCVFHILHASLHIEINDATGVIGAISVIDTNCVNEANGYNESQLHSWITNVAIDANDVIVLFLFVLLFISIEFLH